MSDIIAPLINGRRFSFASLEIVAKIGATSQELFLDVDAISYSESLEIEFKRGTSSVPLGSTRGNWVPQEGSMQMGKSTFNKMVSKIGPGWLGINLIMNVFYQDIGETLANDTIAARLVGKEDSHDYGPSPLVTVVKFMPTTPILHNGISGMLNRVF